MSVSYSPGTLARELCRSLLLPLEPLIVSTPLLEPSLTRSKAALREPRLPVVTDPRADTSLSQRSLVLTIVPITDSPLHYADIAIVWSNKGAHSVGLMCWVLAREVLGIHGTTTCKPPSEIIPDLSF